MAPSFRELLLVKLYSFYWSTLFWDKVSHNSSWPWTPPLTPVAEDGLELWILLLPPLWNQTLRSWGKDGKNKDENMTQGLIPEMIQKVLELRNLQEQQYLWNNHKMFWLRCSFIFQTYSMFHRQGNQGLGKDRGRVWIPQPGDCWTGTLPEVSLLGILVVLRQDSRAQWRRFCRLTYERPQQWKDWQPLVCLNCTKPREHAQKSPCYKNLLWVHKRSLHTSLQPPFPFWALWTQPQARDPAHLWAPLHIFLNKLPPSL